MASHSMKTGGTGLSGVVCGLVRDVRRVVRDGRDPQEVRALHWRIDQLRGEIGSTSNGPLHRYLDALQAQLNAG
jgi:hypothetical protein